MSVPEQRTALVEVTDLCLFTGDRPVVDGVEFSIQPGESVALVGASGSGKTTTALAVLGLLRPGITRHRGSVRLAGADVFGVASDKLRGHVAAYLGQDPGVALNPYRRVSSTLLAALGPPARRNRRGRVDALLRRVALAPALADRYPHQLSGGQQQRVCLAVALAREPRLLVLDEPTAALDIVSKAEVQHELSELRGRGVAMLWITHDLASLEAGVDRVVVLDQGRVVEQAPYALLVSKPRSPAGRALVEAVPHNHGARAVITARAVLTGRGLSAGYTPGVDVLRDVDLDVAPGECLAILGVSGVGKTTLARTLVGLHPTTSGSLCLDDADLADRVRARSVPERAAVQLVPQDPAATLHPRQSVRTALTRPLRLFRNPRRADVVEAEVQRLIAEVQLPADVIDRLPAELSGGQRQRVALARALAARPRVLVCDEITSALDTVTQAAMLSLLDLLRSEESLAVVLITHDPSVAMALADRVLVLAEGGVHSCGPTADILPPGATTAELSARLLGIAAAKASQGAQAPAFAGSEPPAQRRGSG